jgi:AcrR family transcriptional regulator
MTTPADPNAARRMAIVDAALQVFLRYGFKKTSMDDLARAAGLSRQGLYLHFPTKELLFKAAVQHTLEAMHSAFRAALAQDERDIEERLVAAFDAIHGSAIGFKGSGNFDELLELTATLMGPVEQERDAAVIADLSRALRQAGVVGGRKGGGVSPNDLAEHLFSVSYGWKHRVTTADAYRDAMRIAVRIACRGSR